MRDEGDDAVPEPDDDEFDTGEWGPEDARTILDALPLEDDDGIPELLVETDPAEEPTPAAVVDPRTGARAPTPAQGLELLPGYEVGFEEGKAYQARRTMEHVMDILREELIAGGTDPGVAFMVADKLRRKAGHPGY